MLIKLNHVSIGVPSIGVDWREAREEKKRQSVRMNTAGPLEPPVTYQPKRREKVRYVED
jgi:hypothetical protein